MKMNRVWARAPLRISFAGGGTDIAPFRQTEGGIVLSATIARYAMGSLIPRGDGRIHVRSADFGISLDFPARANIQLDGKLDLVKVAIRRLAGNERMGYDLVLRSDVPPGSGLGLSSAILVALAGMLLEYQGSLPSVHRIAQLAHDMERVDAGIPGGMQDHYAAAFGGLNCYEFRADEVIVNRLRLRPEIERELQLSLLLCFTGATRKSASVITDQLARLGSGDVRTLDGLRAQKRIATAMKDALIAGQLNTFGELLGEAWRKKKQLSPMISTPRIEEAFEIAQRNGARAGKVTGAGGGGHILFFCEPSRRGRLAQALSDFGMTVTGISFESRGLITWRGPYRAPPVLVPESPSETR